MGAGGEDAITGTFDVAVVGASFAGLACATACARGGLATVVLERKPAVEASPHTTGIVVKEAADAFDLPADATRAIRRVRLFAPSMRSIDLEAADYFFLATDHARAMQTLAGRAEAAGADLRLGTAFSTGRLDDGRVVLDDLGVRTRILVGADGPRSSVARAFSLGVNRRFLRGAEAEFSEAAVPDPDAFYCLLSRKIAPGYLAWLVPGVGSVQVGLAATMPHRPDLGALVAAWEGPFGLRRDRITGHRGGLIPCAGPVAPLAAGNVILTGDAAGIVSPLTGGGLHTAHVYGAALGEAIVAHLRAGGPPPADVVARIYPKFWSKRVQRRLFEWLGHDPLFDLALGTAAARTAARAVFFRPKRL